VVRVTGLPEAASAVFEAIVPEGRFEAGPGEATLSFRAGENDGRLAAVLAEIQTLGAVVRGIEGQPPSLEEVFAHYTAEAPAPDGTA
jgi:hypothetical protein